MPRKSEKANKATGQYCRSGFYRLNTMCFVYFNSIRNITCLVFFVCCVLLYSFVSHFSKDGQNTIETVSLNDVNMVEENTKIEFPKLGKKEKEAEPKNLKTGRSELENPEMKRERKKVDGSEIDLVYNWMNGSDPQFKENLMNYLKTINRKRSDIFALNRYHDFGSLKYSLRSVELYANWFRHIFIVTNGQIPHWLNLNNSRISIVTHEDIFPNKKDLPTFSFQAVESHLFRIEGLSKRFVCMYDDIILTSKVVLEDFLSQSGQFKVRYNSGDLQGCSSNCRAENVNNGKCEKSCYTESCEWDGDDCIGKANASQLDDNEMVKFDSWKGSIMHTQFLFNKEFGPRNREIPRAGPHLYDKDIFQLLHERFSVEWTTTSSYKIRHKKSLNIQFAYYHFLYENAMLGLHNMSFSNIEITKCCGYLVLTIDDKDYQERKLHLDNIGKEIQLKKLQFIITANKFKSSQNIERVRQIEKDIEDNLFKKLFPKPSAFEI